MENTPVDRTDLEEHVYQLRHSQDQAHQHRLFELVRDPRWRSLRNRIDPTARGFQRDLVEAWDLAHEQNLESLNEIGTLNRMTEEVFCATEFAMMRDRGAGIPPNLIAMLCQRGLWTTDQAIDVARQQPDPTNRAVILGVLSNQFRGPARIAAGRAAIEAVRGAPAGLMRARALASIAADLRGALRTTVMAEMLESLDAVPKALDRAIALMNVEPTLRDGRWRGALDAVAGDLERQSDPEAMITGIAILIGSDRTEAERLRLLGRAMDIAAKLPEESTCLAAMEALSSQLSTSSRCAKLALDRSTSIPFVGARHCFLAEILPYLSPPLRSKVVTVLLSVPGKDISPLTAQALATAAPFLSRRSAWFTRAVGLARNIWFTPMLRIRVMTALASHAPRDQRNRIVKEVLSQADKDEDPESTIDTSAHLARFLPPGERRTRLARAVDAVARVTDSPMRFTLLNVLAPELKPFPDLLTRAVEATTRPFGLKRMLKLLAMTLDQLDPGVREEFAEPILQMLRALDPTESPTDVLVLLISKLPSCRSVIDFTIRSLPQIPCFEWPRLLAALRPGLNAHPFACMQALHMGLSVQGFVDRAETLGALFPILPAEWRPKILAKLLEEVASASERAFPIKRRAELLTQLAEGCAGQSSQRSIVSQLLRLIDDLKDPDDQVDALCRAASVFSDDPDAQARALNLIFRMPLSSRLWSAPRLKALRELTTALQAQQSFLGQVLGRLVELGPPDHIVEFLESVLPMIVPQSGFLDLIRMQSLTFTSELQCRIIRAIARCATIDPSLTPVLWDQANRLETVEQQLSATVTLLTHLPVADRGRESAQLLNVLNNVTDATLWLAVAIDLLPFLGADQRDGMVTRLLAAIADIKEEDERRSAFERVAPLLPEEPKMRSALRVARELRTPVDRYGASSLIPNHGTDEKSGDDLEDIRTDFLLAIENNVQDAVYFALPNLTQVVDRADAYTILHQALRRVAWKGTETVLEALEATLPIWRRIGGARAVSDLSRAMLAISERDSQG